MNRTARLLSLALVAALPACSWDFTQLPIADFRKNLCDVIDNYQKNAQDNASRIQDQNARDAAYRDINTKLGQLAEAKLKAVNAYSNCNEAELKAAQAIAESIVGGITKVAGNLAKPARAAAFRVQGQKTAGPGPRQMRIDSGSNLAFVAGTRPTNPLQVGGNIQADFVPTPNGFQGPIVDLQLQVQLPGVATWNVALDPDPSNQLVLQRLPSGAFDGDMHVSVIVDGPGVRWPLVVELPLTMDATETRWQIDSGGMVPADPFFPLAPAAGVRFGHGCAGGLPAEPHLEPSSVVRVGEPLTVRIDEGPANGFAALVIGAGQTQIDLSFLFGVGCELFVTPDLMLLSPLDPLGSGLPTVPLPPDPGLAGADLMLQGITLDPARGFAAGMTGGLRQTVYPR